MPGRGGYQREGGDLLVPGAPFRWRRRRYVMLVLLFEPQGTRARRTARSRPASTRPRRRAASSPASRRCSACCRRLVEARSGQVDIAGRFDAPARRHNKNRHAGWSAGCSVPRSDRDRGAMKLSSLLGPETQRRSSRAASRDRRHHGRQPRGAAGMAVCRAHGAKADGGRVHRRRDRQGRGRRSWPSQDAQAAGASLSRCCASPSPAGRWR